jgi:hypothetical protein
MSKLMSLLTSKLTTEQEKDDETLELLVSPKADEFALASAACQLGVPVLRRSANRGDAGQWSTGPIKWQRY